MSFLKDMLFGKKVSFIDTKIGELTARVKNDNSSINYTWSGEYMLSGQKKPTVFILEGNAEGPYKQQLASVYRIVDTLDSIILWVDSQLKQKENFKPIFKDWKDTFYLAAITPYNPDTIDIRNMFEITFEPVIEKEIHYLGLTWVNDRFSEFVAK